MMFISYATPDLAYATEVFRQLYAKNYDVWFAPVAIRYGENFAKRIGEALFTSHDNALLEQLKCVKDDQIAEASIENHPRCRALIFICSQFSQASVWCRKEVLSAISKKIPVFVIRVDHCPDKKDWQMMLIDIQSITAPKFTAEVLSEIVRFLPPELATPVKSSADPSPGMQALTYRDIQIEKISGADFFFTEGESLFCTLSKQCFFLSPPDDMVSEELQLWRNEHFQAADTIFNSSLVQFQEQTGIPDLVKRIERARLIVFSNFINHENGCYFNNKKYGINRINPFGRTEDFTEIPVLSLELFTTDYFTHRVIKHVCKELYQEHHQLFHKGFNFGTIEKYKILLTSLGINLLLFDGNARLNQKTLLTVRSANCAETNGHERYSLSVIEGVSLSDYDHFQRKVNLSDSLKRGLEEELGVTPEMLDSESLKFYDLFINLQNLEIGISCSATLKTSYSLDYVAQLRGKDKDLEVRSTRIIPTSALRNFVIERKDRFLPQAIFAIGSYVNRYEKEPLIGNDVEEYEEEQFLLGKHPDPAKCEDVIFTGEHYYAVIDGVTSSTALRNTSGVKTGGRYAAEILSQALSVLDKDASAEEALLKLNRAIADATRHAPENVMGKILANIIIYSKKRKEIWSYGDCNLMINEQEFVHKKELDHIFASVRAFVISAHLKNGGDPAAVFADDPGRKAILPFLEMQSQFANSNEFFGYPVLDGKTFNPRLLKIYRVVEGDHVVLASDGYPKLFSSLRESEEHLHSVLALDPMAISSNMQTKMCSPDANSFDDRAYLSFFVK